MTLYRQDFEAGTVGSSPATGSGGLGNTGIALLGTGTITSTAGEVISGSKSAKLNGAAATASYINMPSALSTTQTGAYAEVRLMDSSYDTSEQIFLIRNTTTSPANKVFGVNFNASGQLTISGPGGTYYTTPSPLAVPGAFVIEALLDAGTSTTDGKFKFRIRNKSDLSMAAGMTDWVEQTGKNMGAGLLTNTFQVGKLTTVGTAAKTVVVDNMYIQDGYAPVTPASVIAYATGNGGALTNGSNIAGTTNGGVADGAEVHFISILGPGTNTTTLTTVTNTLNNGNGALVYNFHQDVAVCTVGWGSAAITTSQSDWTAELDLNLANRPTSSANIIRGYSDGAFATSIAILRVLSTGALTLFLGTGSTTVLTTPYTLTAGVNYRIGLEIISATSARVAIFTIGSGGAMTTVYDSGTVSHAVAATMQSITYGIGTGSSGVGDMKFQPRVGYGPGMLTTPAATSNNLPGTVAGPIVSMNSGTTANITANANDTDGTIASFVCSLASTTSTTNPTVGTPVVTGAGTNSASVSIPISNLTPGDHFFAIYSIDNNGGLSPTVMDEIIYSALAPTRRSVTINGVTQTLPASGTAVAALNNQANVPVSFTTAGPPAAGAGVIEVYQPLDPANVAPYYGQWWAASDTNTPITVYVDLKFNGVTKATVSQVLNSTTPVFVGKTLNSTENNAIGSGTTARVLPSVESRFS